MSLGEAVEKLVRLQQVLGRQRLFVDARERWSGYAGVIDPLLLVLNGQAETLGRNSARISSLIQGEALDEEQRIALAGIIQTVINVVLTLHELLVLLPREAPEPQVFRVLRDCFKSEWQNTSVIMTNALSSYEYRIEDVLEKLEDIMPARSRSTEQCGTASNRTKTWIAARASVFFPDVLFRTTRSIAQNIWVLRAFRVAVCTPTLK